MSKPFFVDVITTERNDPEKVIEVRQINYTNSRSREWLAKHSYWALRKGYAVHTAATPPSERTDD